MTDTQLDMALERALPQALARALEQYIKEHHCIMFTTDEASTLKNAVRTSRTVQGLIVSAVVLSIVGGLLGTFYLGARMAISNMAKDPTHSATGVKP